MNELTIEEKAEKFDKLVEKMLSYKNTFKIQSGMLYYCVDLGADGATLHPLIRIRERK